MKTTTRPFSRLSKADQRRAICRDALAQLRAKKIIAATGRFIQFPYTGKVTKATSLRRLLAHHEGPCETCALGSILASQVRVNGDCTLGQQRFDETCGTMRIHPLRANQPIGKGGLFSAFIKRYFDADQLQLIEIAFERGRGAFRVCGIFGTWDERRYADTAAVSNLAITAEQTQAAVAFGEAYESDLNRLRAILKKIIRSKEAVFVP